MVLFLFYMKYYILLILILFFSSNVYAGVGIATQKDNINLQAGDTDTFQYEIQTIGIRTPQSCSFSFQESANLNLSFDINPISVPPNSRTQVFGKVTAPQKTKLGSYAFNFCVFCTSLEDKNTQASALSQSICNIPLKVNIVEKSKEGILNVKPLKKIPDSLLVVGIMIFLIVIILFIKEIKRKNLYRQKS